MREREAAAVLLSQGYTQEETAKLVGVNPASLTFWKKDPRFAQLERMAIQEQMRKLVGEHVGAFQRALRTLVRAIDGEELPEQQVETAMKVWLAMFGKAEAMFSQVQTDDGDWYDDAQSE